MSHPNFILAGLSETTLAAVRKQLAVVKLEQGQLVAETHQQIRRVYFPHSGMLSVVVDLVGGGGIEAGVIGKDGVFGALQALDTQISLNRVVVQVPGESSVIEPKALSRLALELPDLREPLIRYELFLHAQVQQAAACNATHKVRSRLARWLLRVQAICGDELHLTQEFLAQMIGVRRPSVNDVAKELAGAGIISYRRGQIQILDTEKLREWACECEDDLRDHYQHLFHPSE
ncbi:Crp/Fnr family transcriptional regulator [Tardiphaga sp.]|uniref:Crp/Fnr family transcriptional regulator n=1 Tax=Tardiphaga sp. TaxID=1926292 RepID=UPI0037D99CD1